MIKKRAVRKNLAVGAAVAFLFLISIPSAHAIVGQAEEFDRFEAQKLEDFHTNLTHEEERKNLERADQTAETLKEKIARLKTAKGEELKILQEEMDVLKKQLLSLPKRDRVRFGVSGSHTYDTNANRSPEGDEDDDSGFDTGGGANFDFSGRKTDLRFEVQGQKSWSVEYPEKDMWGMQETLRFRRKYFKKITQSAQSRIGRQNSKTVEIKGEKVRWDSAQSWINNLAFSKKFSVNTDTSLSHRLFLQEAFDQDSSWETSSAPSLFLQLNPKSRVSTGYRIAQNRIRTKTGNTVAHEINLGYFGQVSRKSSTSFNLSYGRQVPRAQGGSITNTVNTGVGYIWQWTPKTQLTLQAIRSQQNSTTNPVDNSTPASATGETEVSKTSTHITNNSATLSLNTRLNNKLRGTLTGTVNRSFSHTSGGGQSETEAGTIDPDHAQYGFQVSAGLSYFFSKALSFSTSYSFSERMGEESADASKGHVLKSSMDLRF